MARKPNYSFERNSREKAKAAKREAKRQAKLAAKEKKNGVKPTAPAVDSSATEATGAEESTD